MITSIKSAAGKGAFVRWILKSRLQGVAAPTRKSGSSRHPGSNSQSSSSTSVSYRPLANSSQTYH